MSINVKSEIGKLKQVLLHRPGEEVENLTPSLMETLLFDDIPYLKIAQQEHDCFANCLKNKGVEVFYIEQMVAESIEEFDIKNMFIEQFLTEASVHSKATRNALKGYLLNMDNKTMIDKMIAGICKHEVKISKKSSITDHLNDSFPFYTAPLPNLLFVRDPFASIGNGITVNKMHTDTRRRETLFIDYIFNYHPMYIRNKVTRWYNRNNLFSIEGGDELVLTDKILAIGISERTQAEAIEQLAKTLFKSKDTSFEKILAFYLPNKRAFMHLDTVFTQLDYDKFTVHSEILITLKVVELTPCANNNLKIKLIEDTLENILNNQLNIKVELIMCGGGRPVIAEREQWNDGANTLAIAPGEVVVYSRNYVTNRILEEKGIKINVIPSSELSRGRGGPRCMSMPLQREDL